MLLKKADFYSLCVNCEVWAYVFWSILIANNNEYTYILF